MANAVWLRPMLRIPTDMMAYRSKLMMLNRVAPIQPMNIGAWGKQSDLVDRVSGSNVQHVATRAEKAEFT